MDRNELSERVMYYMQSVMHALCRHVPKNGLQREGGGWGACCL